MTKKAARRCIVNMATGRFKSGQERLRNSVNNICPDIPLLTWQHEGDIGSPTHKEAPYAFKIYAIKKAQEQGYDSILWVDASMFMIKRPERVFAEMEGKGFVFQVDGDIGKHDGHVLGRWCNDETLKYFDIKREDAQEIGLPLMGFCGFSGFSGLPNGEKFLKLWEMAMKDGMFQGSWDDHRHDMSCGAAIIHQLKLKMWPGQEFVAYGDENIHEKTEILCKGLSS